MDIVKLFDKKDIHKAGGRDRFVIGGDTEDVARQLVFLIREGKEYHGRYRLAFDWRDSTIDMSDMDIACDFTAKDDETAIRYSNNLLNALGSDNIYYYKE